MTTTIHSLHPSADGSMGRLALAHGLRAAAALLHRLADRMTPAERHAAAALTLPRLEFHGDAGAPEGALYVDGVLFGHLPGVHRL